jgi:hypothetical protein
MKKWFERLFAMLAEPIGGILFVTRYPGTDRSSRIMVSMWALALALACLSVGMYVRDGDYGAFFLWMNLAVAALDVYMLRRSIQGLRYRRERRGRVSRRALP